MTTLESLVDVSLRLLKANGRWVVYGIDETLRRDIRATVEDVSRLFRDDCAHQLIEMAIRELEHEATMTAMNPTPRRDLSHRQF